MADSKKKEEKERSGRKKRYVLAEVGIFLAREGPRLVKKLQNWFAIKRGSEISWLSLATLLLFW